MLSDLTIGQANDSAQLRDKVTELQQTEAMTVLQDQLTQKEGELAAAHTRADEIKSKAKVMFQGLKEQKLSLVRRRDLLRFAFRFFELRDLA